MITMSFDTFFQDVRYAFRSLRRDRSFAVGAILILTLGMGTNTAVFSLVDGVLFRPLNYPNPDRLFAVQEVVPQLSQLAPELPVNARHYREWRRRCTCFEGVAMANQEEMNLTGVGEPERISTAHVTENFFSVLGVSAQIGR